MKTIKTAEAEGPVLDWLVAQANGMFLYSSKYWELVGDCVRSVGAPEVEFHPTTNWAQGGPIVEREKITVSDSLDFWAAGYNGTLRYFGPTPLIAAMRCFVMSKLGEVVEVPEELT